MLSVCGLCGACAGRVWGVCVSRVSAGAEHPLGALLTLRTQWRAVISLHGGPAGLWVLSCAWDPRPAPSSPVWLRLEVAPLVTECAAWAPEGVVRCFRCLNDMDLVLCIWVYLVAVLCTWVLFEGSPLLNVLSCLAGVCLSEVVYLIVVHLGIVLRICAGSGIVLSLFLGLVFWVF